MNFTRTKIEEVLLCKPIVHMDGRGYFMETFQDKELSNFLGYNIDFCQDNESKSSKGVLRGLHYQLAPFAQTKLVRVIQGKVLDVVVDIRKGSPTFGKHVKVLLSAENKLQLFIPKGFAHGFLVLEDDTIFSYKVDSYYSAEHDRGILFNDPFLGIDWGLEESLFSLSPKDIKQVKLSDSNDLFDYKVNYYA